MLDEVRQRAHAAERQRLEAMGVNPASVGGEEAPAWQRALEIGARLGQGDPRQN